MTASPLRFGFFENWARHGRIGVIGLLAAMAAGLGLLATAPAAMATQLDATSAPLAGSDFQGGDGNQTAHSALSYRDWGSLVGTMALQQGTNYDASNPDTEFGQGSAENEPDKWQIASPTESTPGKTNFKVAWNVFENEEFLYLGFRRHVNQGNSYLAFELNQDGRTWTDPATGTEYKGWKNGAGTWIPCRRTGDLLVTYYIANANANQIELFLEKWQTHTAVTAAEEAAGRTNGTGCAKTGTLVAMDLNTAYAQGAINNALNNGNATELPLVGTAPNERPNAGSIPDEIESPKNVCDGKTGFICEGLFGETALNMPEIFASQIGASPCFNFGSIWAHGRASTSPSSSLQDFVSPIPVLVRNCTISGTKWHDLDADGTQDAGEPTIAGYKLYVDSDNDNQLDADEPTAVTDAAGNYQFVDVNDGSHTIREAPDTEQLSANRGMTCSFPANAECEHVATLTASDRNVVGKDFGNFRSARLTVEKQTSPDGASGSFSFTTSLAAPNDTFNLGDGGTRQVTVNPGTYTAAEAAHNDFTLTGLACTGDSDSSGDLASRTATYRLQSGEDVTCVFTNTRKTGQLKVVKELSPATDPGKFDLSIGSDVVVDDGGDGANATRTLSTGTYSVSEAAGAGTTLGDYTSAVECRSEAGTVVATGTTSAASVPVAHGELTTCTFTNTRKTGQLKLVKELSPATDPGKFDLRVGSTVVVDDAGDGGNATVTRNTGTYEVSEIAGTGTTLSDYTSAVECVDEQDNVVASGTTSAASVPVAHGELTTCTFTNTRKTGQLKVVKELSPATDPGKFDLSIGSTVVVDDGGDGANATETLNTGTYSVSEAGGTGTSLSDYDSELECRDEQGNLVASGSTSATGVPVDHGELTTCVFTNTRRTGGLKVVKDLSPASDPGRFDLSIGSTVVVDDGGDGANATETLNTGTYSVSEAAGTGTSLGDYTSALECRAEDDTVVATGTTSAANVPVVDGELTTCVFTNTRKTGQLKVVKELSPATDPGKFDLRIGSTVVVDDGGDGANATETLNTGTYSVSEAAGAGTSLSDYASELECVDEQDNVVASGTTSATSVPVAHGELTTCTFTNTRRTGGLKVVKELSPATDPGRFDLSIGSTVVVDDGGDGANATETLNTGTYSVSEAAGTGTSLGDYDSALECRAQDGTVVATGSTSATSVPVVDGELTTCVFTNTRKTGRLKLVKELSPATDPGKFDLRIGSTVVVDDGGDGANATETLNTGTYSVSEAAGTGTTLADYASELECRAEDDTVVATGTTSAASVPVVDGELTTCVFTNTRETGRLKVVKELAPSTDTGVFDLSIGSTVVVDDGGDGASATETLNTGTYSVSEAAGTGTSLGDYTSALECRAEDGTVVATGTTSAATVPVADGELTTCVFTNTRDATVTIRKDAQPDDDQDFPFTTTGSGMSGFTLDDDGDAANERSNAVTFEIPAAEFGTKSVTEAAQSGWRLSGIECTGTEESVENRTATFAVGAGDVVDCTFTNVQLTPGITVSKAGPDFAYHGDTLTFRFEVTNPGNTPLHDVVVTDDRCAPVTLQEKTGGDQDGELESGEVWIYTCSYTLGAHTAGEEDPIHNTATVTAEDEQDRPVGPVTDDHFTEILHPAIAIDKTGPAGADAGDRVAFTLTVTNPGDVAIPAATVAVTDSRCDAPPEQVSKRRNGQADPTPNSLDPGDVWTYRCFVQTGSDDASITNVATVTGRDVNGRPVSDRDDHFVGLREVLAVVERPGSSRLRGPARCKNRPFTARVVGKRIQSVLWRIDGKRVGWFYSASGEGKRSRLRVRPKVWGRGLHRLTAKVRYNPAAQTKTKKMRMTFRLCARKAQPRFTG